MCRHCSGKLYRLAEIRHESLGGTLYYGIVYTWNLNSTVSGRIETESVATRASDGRDAHPTQSTYDARDRLIREQRQQAVGGGGAAGTSSRLSAAPTPTAIRSPASDGWTLNGNPQWTDYWGGAGVSPAGDTPQGDATLTGGAGTFALSHQTRYFGFAGQQSLDAGGSPTSTRYFHGDLIDSNVMTSNETGTPQATTAYTAFGEPAGGTAGPGVPPGDPSALGTRYQYAGAYGYEAGMLSVAGANTNLPPITLSHVGARWYQPGIGRFVQRDPIGLRGGTNVYVYANSRPLCSVDPSGLYSRIPVKGIDVPIDFKGHIRWPKPTPPFPWWKPGFPVTPAVFGWCALAAGVGVAVGVGADIGVKAATGRSISERLGRWIYDNFWSPNDPRIKVE